MESLRRSWPAAAAACLTAFILYEAAGLLFSPFFRQINRGMEQKRAAIQSGTRDLGRMERYRSYWESSQSLLDAGDGGKTLANVWVRDLMAYASGESLFFTKVEPQEGSGKEKGLRLAVTFRGDAGRLAGLLDHLHEKDPSARLLSLKMKRETEDGIFQYELLLAKGMK